MLGSKSQQKLFSSCLVKSMVVLDMNCVRKALWSIISHPY